MIEVSHIRKRYGKKQVLEDIHFEVHSGSSVVIVGVNGCGKSTLLQIMAGVMKADDGKVRYFQEWMGRDRSRYRKYCGYVPQENPLLEELSVKDNLRLWSAGRKAEMERTADIFGLSEILSMPVAKLSGGMKRRLSIACSFLDRPPVLLMDEPGTALDLYYQKWLRQWMKEYLQNNGTILMTSHNEREIQEADRCLLMENGRLTELSDRSLLWR